MVNFHNFEKALAHRSVLFQKVHMFVIPAKAGIQQAQSEKFTSAQFPQYRHYGPRRNPANPNESGSSCISR